MCAAPYNKFLFKRGAISTNLKELNRVCGIIIGNSHVLRHRNLEKQRKAAYGVNL